MWQKRVENETKQMLRLDDKSCTGDAQTLWRLAQYQVLLEKYKADEQYHSLNI